MYNSWGTWVWQTHGQTLTHHRLSRSLSGIQITAWRREVCTAFVIKSTRRHGEVFRGWGASKCSYWKKSSNASTMQHDATKMQQIQHNEKALPKINALSTGRNYWINKRICFLYNHFNWDTRDRYITININYQYMKF